MQPEVRLTIRNGAGRGNVVTVQSRRFSIGRNPDNDLTIQDSSLSRRHAIIENFDGIIQISDCGSQNGTWVNNNPVVGGVVLRNGDLISLGDSCELTVQISSNDGAGIAPSSQPAAVESHPGPFVPASGGQYQQASTLSWLSVPVIAAVSVIVILLGAVILILVLGTGTDKPRVQLPENTNTLPINTAVGVEIEDDVTGQTEVTETRTDVGKTSTDQVEKAAIQVMRRISSDDKTYSFSEQALSEIEQKVNEYRSRPGLAASLTSMQRASGSIAAQARREGIEAGLVFYVALAESDGGRSGDPVSISKAIMPDLLKLRAIFGTTDADGSLILIAASQVGKAERRSHPLLPTIRRVVRNPLTQRNVWYLHERGGLSAGAYDFVLRVLALGVIAQDPKQFGVAADPLVF